MLKPLAKALLRAGGVQVKRYSDFARAVDLLAAAERKPFFIQIGANNGIDFDDTYEAVTRHRLPGIVVEPVEEYYQALVLAYARYPEVLPVRAALHPTETEMRMYRVDPAQATEVWHHGLASFSREHLLRHGVGESAVIAEVVPAVDFERLVAEHAPPGVQVDILAVDTEGFDAEVLAMVDMDVYQPRVVRFEAKHMQGPVLEGIRGDLLARGLRVRQTKEDCVAVAPDLHGRWRYAARAARLGRRVR